MSRNKRKQQKLQVLANNSAVISTVQPKKGKDYLFWLAFLLIALGYFSLYKTDPAGLNYWSITAPLSLVTGYLCVLYAILSNKE